MVNPILTCATSQSKNDKAELSLGQHQVTWPVTHQSNYGTLSCELGGTEERTDKSVDLFLFRVVLVIVWRQLRFLWEEKVLGHSVQDVIYSAYKWAAEVKHLLKVDEVFHRKCLTAFARPHSWNEKG